MIKVVFVGHRDLYFGAESVMFRVIRLLKDKDIAEPLVVLPKSDNDGFSRMCMAENIVMVKRWGYKLIGGSLFRCLLCLGYNMPALTKLHHHFRKHNIDLFYTNTSVNILGPMLALLLNKAHIWHFHEQPASGIFKWIPPGLFPMYRFLITRKKTTVVFVSNTQKSLWEKEFGFKIANSKVIYTPPKKIPEAATKKYSEIITQDAELSPGKETVTFGYLGSWTASKNLLSLLADVAKLKSNHQDVNVRLILMGAGELESAITSTINLLGLQNQVTLMPHSTAVLPFFSEISIFVLPSWFESWGLAALEAVLQRKALIVTCNSALTEILTQNVDCLYTDPSKEGSLYAAMEQLLLHPDDRINMANHAYLTLQGLNLDAQFEESVVSLFLQQKHYDSLV